MFQDLRYGLVLLRRDFSTSALIIVVLALGIGTNAAMFTLLKAAFLDPLPYPDAARLITVSGNNRWNPSVSEFFEIRARNHTLQELGFAEYRDMQLSGSGEPQRVFAARVSSTFLPLLGAHASLGRSFLEEENQPGRAARVMLSHAFWQSKMGADPAAVGRTLRLDGQLAVIIGVLPAAFQFDYPTLRIAEPVDLYVPYPIQVPATFKSTSSGSGGPVLVLARLRDGLTMAQTRADLERAGRAMVHDHPESYHARDGGPGNYTFETFPLREAIVGTQAALLWLLLGGADVLLLIACANAAQLLLARSLRRGKEIAVRAAVGASRLRLIRQFLLEGVVLAVCGCFVGLLIAAPLTHFLISASPVRSPLLQSARLDLQVIAFTMAVSLLSTLVFATLPAIKGSAWMPGPALTARFSIGEGNRWRNVMIGLEAALSVFLLCGAGLIAQNLWTLVLTPAGFDPDHVLVMRLKLPALQPNSLDPSVAPQLQHYLTNIAAIPGVESAATVTGPPMHPAIGGPTEILGETDGAGKLKTVITDIHQVSADYFRVLRIPLLAGRVFRDSDTAGRPRVAIVNEEFARRFALGRSVIGRRTDEGLEEPFTIVGLVGNARTRALNTAPVPEIYISSLQFPWSNIYLMLRSTTPPSQLVKRVKTAIESANPDQSVFDVMPMRDLLADSVNEPRFQLFLIGSFALLAVAMAAAGLYSVICFLVSQRINEIAIRIALGATRGAIIRTILGAVVAWVAVGLAFGLVLALATRDTVRSLSNTSIKGSVWMYLAIAIFFLLVTLTAAYLPVRRASRLDPATALRRE